MNTTPKLKVLVVDDKKVIGDLFEFTLGYNGHQVKIVENAEDAIHLMQKEPFDIAFLDIVMPGIDGVQLIGEIRKLDAHIPLVMMSGFSVEYKKQMAKTLGAVAFLRKPFEYDDIKRVIKIALGRDV